MSKEKPIYLPENREFQELMIKTLKEIEWKILTEQGQKEIVRLDKEHGLPFGLVIIAQYPNGEGSVSVYGDVNPAILPKAYTHMVMATLQGIMETGEMPKAIFDPIHESNEKKKR